MNPSITSVDDTHANPALQVHNVVKDFGGTRALDGVDLTVRPGEIHALLGANGAGKSTLLGVIARSVVPDSGEVTTAQPVEGGTNTVAIVYQELSLLPELSVAENVCPAQALFGSKGLSRTRAARAQAAEALRLLRAGLEDDLDKPVKDLPLDKREMVEIARGFCSGGRVILLDEPTSPLTEAQVDRLFQTMRTLAHSGLAIVLVSHRMREIRAVADVATVIRDGKTVLDARPLAEVSDDELTNRMIGRSVEATRASGNTSGGTPSTPSLLLKIHDTSSGRSIDVYTHELVGIAALTQEDARQLVRYAWGAERLGTLRREVLGKPRRWWTPRRAARAGVAYVSGDRKHDALFPQLDLRDNVMTPTRVVKRSPWLGTEHADAQGALNRLEVKYSDPFATPESLSGGNQQKMLFAAWLALDLRLLLLDDPTRGVDVEATAEIHDDVHAVLANGAAGLLWSSDTEELAQVCDRVIIIRGTTPVTTLTAEELTEPAILTALNSEDHRG
jgi:ribose transport system ATP-binding protein